MHDTLPAAHYLDMDSTFGDTIKKIEKLKNYPQIHGKPLRRPLTGKWELRFEDKWRILYIINEKEMQVEIETIWHKDDF